MPTHAFRAIPTLDLSQADQGGAARAALLAQLRHALVDVGFLYVVNHGVPDAVVADMVAVLPALFALPAADKAAMALHNSPHFLGYSAAGAETTAGRADQREQVEFATELPADWAPGQPLCERLRGPSQWPPALPQLRPVVRAYLDALTALGARFLRLVAAALQLPPDALLPFLADQHRLKLVRYPGADGVGGQGVGGQGVGGQGVGPHKDSSGWWTFLLQASPPHVGGLQALSRDGAWVDVPAVPGAFVVNIGQAFEVVTNGLCPATTHRVLAGPHERFSVPFFQGVRRSLSKQEAVETLQAPLRARFPAHFARDAAEAPEGRRIDAPFLRGRYDTWGESQLRTKIRSHRDVGRRCYADVCDKDVHDEDAR